MKAVFNNSYILFLSILAGFHSSFYKGKMKSSLNLSQIYLPPIFSCCLLSQKWVGRGKDRLSLRKKYAKILCPSFHLCFGRLLVKFGTETLPCVTPFSPHS